jgi:hypothetical protein
MKWAALLLSVLVSPSAFADEDPPPRPAFDYARGVQARTVGGLAFAPNGKLRF